MHEKFIIGDLPIYWINLKRSEDRRNYMIEEFNKYNITNHTRIDAIDGKELDIDLFNNEHNVCSKRKMTISEIGCSLSHIKAIKTAYDNKDEYAIIMEDDCSFEYLKYQSIPVIKLFDYDKKKNLIQLCNITTKCESENILLNCYRNSTVCYVIHYDYMKHIIDTYKNNFKIADEVGFIYKKKITNCIVCPYFTINGMISTQSQKISPLHEKSKKFWTEYYSNKKIYA
jgi:GR25 family glycosyltransferase involved in LPS biosynthesis